MRILHIDTEKTWRGGENQLRLLLAGLKQAGVESHVAVRPDSVAAERLRTLAPVLKVAMRGGFDPLAAAAVASYCRRQQIELIDAHTSNAHSLALVVCQLVPSVRLIVHRRVDYPPKSGWIHERKYKSKRVDRFVAISEAIAGVLIAYGLPPERIRVVRSAVDTSGYRNIDRAVARAELARAYGIDPQLRFLGNASALSEQKGYEVLLQAAARLKQEGAPFHAFIAGDGPLVHELERQRIELGLEHHVTFLGFIQDVPRFLSSLDILAVPSNDEGLGTILLEGLGAGLAIAATKVGGIPEVILPEVTGLLSARGDSDGLSTNLTRLINSPDLCQRLNAAGREHIAKEFSLNSMVQGNLRLYREVLATPAAPES